MARFYGEVWGGRGIGSRVGSKVSGITSHTRGWDLGVRVRIYVDDDGNDVAVVTITGGSRNPSKQLERRTYRLKQENNDE